jgi:hypothetical protein
MEGPSLGSLSPGRSALPALRPVEDWIRAEAAEAAARAEATLAAARAEAERIRREGEERLKGAVLEGQREALRTVADRARDRVSEARRDVAAWVEASERHVIALVAAGVARVVGTAPDAGRGTAPGPTAGPGAG